MTPGSAVRLTSERATRPGRVTLCCMKERWLRPLSLSTYVTYYKEHQYSWLSGEDLNNFQDILDALYRMEWWVIVP